jgi:hypothetical protein
MSRLKISNPTTARKTKMLTIMTPQSHGGRCEIEVIGRASLPEKKESGQ